MSWVIWGVLFLAAAWIVWTYNGLVALRHQIQNAWKQMEVQLKRRYDLIPNLVETVKGYMKYEQDTLQIVIDARSKAMASTGVKETAEAQSALTQSLGKIFVLMENYPELKANANVLGLQEELTTTENQIAFARQYYEAGSFSVEHDRGLFSIPAGRVLLGARGRAGRAARRSQAGPLIGLH